MLVDLKFKKVHKTFVQLRLIDGCASLFYIKQILLHTFRFFKERINCIGIFKSPLLHVNTLKL